MSISKFKAIFITGTDTNIGKTIASAWLCNKLNADYFKPIQSGVENIPPYTDSDFIRSLNLPNTTVFDECYKFEKSLSPHLSSKYANVEIDIHKIQLPVSNKTIIVEGAGGIYVPLNSKEYILDLIKNLSLPTIVVCRSSLGTINHTCLTIKALQQNNIKVIGIIMVGEPNLENKKAIEFYTQIPVIIELPKFSSSNNWQELKTYNENL